PAAFHDELPPPQQTHGLATRRSVERNGNRRPPFHDDGIAATVLDVTAADVPRLALVAAIRVNSRISIEPAEAEGPAGVAPQVDASGQRVLEVGRGAAVLVEQGDRPFPH